MARTTTFDRQALEQALEELGRRAYADGKTVELATRDVDAVFEADKQVVRRLAREIGLTRADEVLDLVAAFYPDRQIEPKTRFGLEEIFAALSDDDSPPDDGTPES